MNFVSTDTSERPPQAIGGMKSIALAPPLVIASCTASGEIVTASSVLLSLDDLERPLVQRIAGRVER